MSEKKDIVFCTGGGCTAKLGAGVLSRILEKLPRGEKDPNLLVGYVILAEKLVTDDAFEPVVWYVAAVLLAGVST